jgi:hypothetical protein
MSNTYEIVYKEGVGRCLVAARNLSPLEIIFEDVPVAVGPEESNDGDVCLACYDNVGGDYRCMGSV